MNDYLTREKRIKKLRITYKEIHSNRVYHITPDDVRIILSRLPYEYWSRLKAIHFNDSGYGGKFPGYVTRGRKEISICALPKRISLTRFQVKGQSPEEFGAVRGTQWPQIAIRRFLLYYVFLYEIGHLQVVDEKAKSESRKFARNGKAKEFAMFWYRQLWRSHFDHEDPVHNPPTKEEIRVAKANSGVAAYQTTT